MEPSEKSVNDLMDALKERAKELNCLYEVEELFNKPGLSLPAILEGIAHAIPPGWQYPDVCQARITYGTRAFETPGFHETPWMQSADISVQDEIVGRIDVCYTEERPPSSEGPFLKEERKLINTIAERLERRIFHERLKSVFEGNRKTMRGESPYAAIIDLLKRTDQKLLARISRKMLYYLSWTGIEEARELIVKLSPNADAGLVEPTDSNRPLQRQGPGDLSGMSDEVFGLAVKYFSEKEVLHSIQKWIMEDRSNFLMKVLEDLGTTLPEIATSIERFHHLAAHGMELDPAREKAFRVSLIRRLLSDDPHFVHTARDFLEINDFYTLLHNVIYPASSHGRLGGKAAGLFLASQILRKSSQTNQSLRNIKVPKTWYLTSDAILQFISHNDLDEIVEQKYEEIARVRQEYPYVVHVFKNSPLPPEIMNGLSVALDDFVDAPLIVRSSSLLEDRPGTSFAGKYKSLFIANQGSKRERLAALADAITEVYASTFSPDALEYRAEHGMVDFHEEMGILIQEVVGKKVGHYFLPAFAGVIFANNDFRWSPRIRREDGLLRMVPGLGTRAVDRLSDDYPVLISPGQPNLRVNVSLEEKIRYSPRKIDVINLKTNSFETMEVRQLFAQFGDEYPAIRHVVSILRNDRLEVPGGLGIESASDPLIVTFDGLLQNTDFTKQVRELLRLLQTELNAPVDIEFAHDGADLYLLQCRPQSSTQASQPAIIPWDIPPDKILFSANRFVTNGTVSGITHVVYVDPQKYAEVESHADLVALGHAVGLLNQVLPKHQFILMGPGRWGSRGDIKLGVSVTYSEINNTAMLIEIARKQRGYMPEPSFGTHFFQDLVEASIRYLPLYPEDRGVIFNENFLKSARNLLPELLPEFGRLADTLYVIDIPEASGGKVLQVLMNGERDEAVAMLTDPSPERMIEAAQVQRQPAIGRKDEDHWRWRLHAAERIAEELDPERFAVRAVYLIGSTKNATAGPQSDIDLLIHFQGNERQRSELTAWLEGWSLSLSDFNFLRTGFKTPGLLDIHIITDEDIRNKTVFGSRIGAITDAPRPLPMKKG